MGSVHVGSGRAAAADADYLVEGFLLFFDEHVR